MVSTDRVRAGAALGDRVALLPLAAHERQHEALDLFGGAGLEHPALRLGEAPAQRVRDAAELFPDRDLVDDARVAAAAGFCGTSMALKPSSIGELLVPLLDLGRQAAFVELRLDLPRNQLLGREL